MKTDEQFLAALQQSHGHVAAVASWMSGLKFDVLIRPVVARPSFDVRNEFIDSGDIEIRQRVEVKKRGIDFTSASDYPYQTVIVDEQYKVDRIPISHLYGYVVVNKAGTHVCCISKHTKPHWLLSTKFDRKDGQDRTFYECPVEHCVFFALEPSDAKS